MARKLRVEHPGAIFHVMNRGDGREPAFKDHADRQRVVETLAEECAKTACLCVAHADSTTIAAEKTNQIINQDQIEAARLKKPAIDPDE